MNLLSGDIKGPYPHADFGLESADSDLESADYSGKIGRL